jgi:hypothetical protein
MRSINDKSGCNGPETGSNCVLYQGTSVPALGIFKGDYLTPTLCAIINKLVDLSSPLDLSTVSIQALKDKLGVEEPVSRTIATMLQIVIDSESTLKDMIDAAIAQINGSNNNLSLDLKCLAQYDSHGNLQTYTQQTVLQSLINQVCGTVDDINTINSEITDLKNQVAGLDVTPYSEPLVTSCLFSAKPASQAVVILASDACTYKQTVGQETDIQSALGKIPTAWTQSYGLIQDWILSPSNFAQSYQNALLVIQNLEARLLNIETSCCKVSCDSIIVDFDVKLSDDRETATLFFATKSNIPVGFHELDPLGTKLLITDSAGAVFTTRVKIIDQLANADGFVIDLNASPLDPFLDYTFSMNPTLTNGALTCVKCVNKVAKYTETCSYCEITANNIGSSNATAIITYQEVGSTVIKSVILHPGDTEVIKKHVKILSVATDGPITLTSPCDLNLGATETYICASILFAADTAGHAAPWSTVNNDAVITEIGYLDKKYPITAAANILNIADQTAAIKAVLPDGVSLYTNIIGRGFTGERQAFKLLVKIPSSFLSTFYIKWKVVDYSPLKIFAEPCTDDGGPCCPSTSSTDTQIQD